MYYTYLIGWKDLNKWYYGVRYSKSCNPSELFVTYFTSSKKVKIFFEKNGYPDIIQIRKTFDCVIKAQIWEHKVLKRMKVIESDEWLNLTDNKAISLNCSMHGWSEVSRKKMSNSRKNKKHSESTKQKISQKHKGRNTPWLTGKSRPEHSLKMLGSNNPKARSVFHDGIFYATFKQFCETNSLSPYYARKLLSSHNRQYEFDSIANKGLQK
jgi:hypothetical protein